MWHPFRSPPARRAPTSSNGSSPNSIMMRSVAAAAGSRVSTPTTATTRSTTATTSVESKSPSFLCKPTISSPLTASCSSNGQNSSSPLKILFKPASVGAGSPCLTVSCSSSNSGQSSQSYLPESLTGSSMSPRTNSSTISSKNSPTFLRKPTKSLVRLPHTVVISTMPYHSSNDAWSLQQQRFSSTSTASESTLSSSSSKSPSFSSSTTSSTLTSSSSSYTPSPSRRDFLGAKRIQEWLGERSKTMPRPIKLDEPVNVEEPPNMESLREKQQLFYSLLESDPNWLSQVTFELLHKVPAGGITREVKSLFHLVMRHQAKVATSAGNTEALLMRLIREEDYGANNFRVTSVLWSFGVDAWARQARSRTQGERAEALLRLQHERYQEDSLNRIPPGVYHATLVLQAWSNSTHYHAAERAEGVLRWMQTDLKIRPNMYSYGTVINAYAQRGKAEDAERLLKAMEDRMEANPLDKVGRPNVKTFTAVIKAWSNAKEGQFGAERAEQVLERLDALYEKFGYTDLRPNRVCFTALMKAWLNSGAPEASSKIVELYERIKEFEASLSEEEQNHRDNRLTLSSYNGLMSIMSKVGQPQVTEEILESMLQRITDGHYHAVVPNDASWATAAYAWAQEGNGDRAEALLHKLNSFYRAGQVTTKPRRLFYNMVLLAWSKSSDKGAAARAQRILDWLEEQDPNGDERIQPNTASYNAVLSAWRRSNDPNAVQMALHLLHRMEEYFKEGRVQTKPNQLSFYIVMDILAAVRTPKSHIDTLNFLNRIESLHESGIYGDLISKELYPLALASCAWTPERDGVVLANEMFLKMKKFQKQNFKPDWGSYDNIIAAWARSPRGDALSKSYNLLQEMEAEDSRRCQPTKFSYNYVLAASFVSDKAEAARIAHDILSRMKDLHETGKPSMTPHPAAFARFFPETIGKEQPLSARAAENMIDWIEKTGGQVDFVEACYAYALQICVWSLDSDAAERAANIWERLLKSSSGAAASLACFKFVLEALDGTEGCAERMEALVERMEKEHAQGTISWRPDTACYDSVVRVWSQSHHEDAPQRSFRILKLMDELYQENGVEGGVVPSYVTYNSVLWACAVTPAKDSDTKLKYFNVAVNAFNHMRNSNYGTPNHIIYNRLLMCAMILGSNPAERERMTTQVFRQCCKYGQLDGRILNHFWKSASNETRMTLLGHDRDQVTIDDVPKEWSCNVTQVLNEV